MPYTQQRAENIEKARDVARRLDNTQVTLDELLVQLAGQTQRLGDDWDHAAAHEVQGYVADIARHVQEVSAMLGPLAQNMRARADEATLHLDDDPPTR